MSIHRGMDKEDVVYIYNGILLSHKKEWYFAICNNLEGTMVSEINQTLYVITYMQKLKNKTNE